MRSNASSGMTGNASAYAPLVACLPTHGYTVCILKCVTYVLLLLSYALLYLLLRDQMIC